MRRVTAALLAIGGLAAARAASAQEPAPAAPKDAPPDLEFLEYLGSWQAADDEWLVIHEWDKDHPQQARPKQDPKRKPEPPRKDDDDSE
jgi:hypothetical protein